MHDRGSTLALALASAMFFALALFLPSCSGSSQQEDVLGSGLRLTLGPPDGGVDGGLTGPVEGPPDASVLEPVARVSGPDRVLDGIYFVSDGAPHPLICARDTDCIGDTVPDRGGCCVRDPEPRPQTWAWHSWVAERRMSEACEGVKCASPPMGRRAPELCKLEARCVSGKCVNGCE